MNGVAAVIKRTASVISILTLLIMSINLTGGAVRTNYAGDLPMWNHIMGSQPAARFSGKPRGVILPHHTITATVVAGFYRGLSAKVSPERIILIGPNHYEKGNGNVITASSCVYETVYGNLEIDMNASDKLVQFSAAVCDDTVFENEHSIYFHSPFIKNFFPRAKILPVLVKWDTPRDELDALVSVLETLADKDTLVISSVDFSHYNMRYSADYHDAASYAAIVNFDYDRIFNCEIDSPGSIYVLERIMSATGSMRCERIRHTNSEDFIGRTIDNTTSHQYFAFYQGKPEYRKTAVILAAGNIYSGDNLLGIQTEWKWDRSYKPETDSGITRYLRYIRGEEDRLLSGYDLYIFDMPAGNPEMNFKINGIDVRLLRVDASVAADRKLPAKNSVEPSCTVAVVYSKSWQNINLKKTGRRLVNRGADIVIFKNTPGGPEHEYYKSKLIVYSLDDFIKPEIDSSGELCQIMVSSSEIKSNFIPLIISRGYPVEKNRPSKKTVNL